MTSTSWIDPAGREPHGSGVCVCGRPARRGLLCRDCRNVLRRQLEDLPGLWRELVTAEVRLARVGERSEGHQQGGERGLPFNEAAGVHARVVAGWLSDTAHSLQARGGRRGLHPQVAVSVILAHFGVLQGRPSVRVVAGEVARLHGRAVRLVDAPDVRQRFQVGPCPEVTVEDGLVVHCPGDVFAWIPSDSGLRPVLACNRCESQWTSEQWRRVGVRIRAEKARRDGVERLAGLLIRGRGVA